MAGLGEARAVLFRRGSRDTPRQRFVLHIALAKPPSDLGLHQLGAKVEGVRAVALNAKVSEEFERVLRYMVALGVEDVDAILGSLDAEIGVPHLSCQRLDVF